MTLRSSGLRHAAALLVAVACASVPIAGQMGRGRQIAGCPSGAAAFHPCALDKAKAFNPPRTPDGHPDLQGLWEAPGAGGLGNIEGRRVGDNDNLPAAPNSLIVDPVNGVIPYQPWARAQKRENAAKYIDPYTHCLPITAPRIMASPRTRQIIQYQDAVTIVNESGGHPFRVIYTDGRPHIAPNLKLWRGDSRGRWEDKTLVIDTTNLNDQSWFGGGGDFNSDALHLTERLTMVDANTLDYAVTVDDPKITTRPWTMVFALERNQEKGYEQMEEGCFESDRDTNDLLLTGFQTYTGPRFPK